MLRLGWRAQLDYGLPAGGVCFDPLSLTALTGASMAAAGVGGTLSAISTIAGGNAAAEGGKLQRRAADAEAAQIDANSAQAIASAQRKKFDTEERTRLAVSTARARGAASGVDTGVGSAAATQGELAKRGSLNAAIDMFNGESAATGLRNQAEAVRFGGKVAELEGKMKRDASYLSAAGTIAGTAGNMLGSYTNLKYPQTRRGYA